SGLVDMVVTPRLEEEVTGLTRGHRDQPADQRGHHRIEEDHRIAEQETRGADEVQRLIDAAVVVVAMVVPALGLQFLHEVLDHDSPPNSFGLMITGIRCPACDIIEMSYEALQRRTDASPGVARYATLATSTLRKRTSEK